ncbi:hypothetical protein BDZ45DRAFT_678508 [Acephala macrosclerotiorum]|nr:hypothetical protein BDZ45DRAFT_678508 [Acephala macrosclerotiorum]
MVSSNTNTKEMDNVPLEEVHSAQLQEPETLPQAEVTSASPDTPDQPPAYVPPLPQRKPIPPPRTVTESTTNSTKAKGGAKEKLEKYTSKAKDVGKFWLDHVKRGEMPWTQWYCCGIVDGKECETENNRVRKECKKCKHRVCGNCVKGTL